MLFRELHSPEILHETSIAHVISFLCLCLKAWIFLVHFAVNLQFENCILHDLDAEATLEPLWSQMIFVCILVTDADQVDVLTSKNQALFNLLLYTITSQEGHVSQDSSLRNT